MATLVTGAAGFIGFHVSRALLERGEEVVGVDDLDAYYLPALKEARLAALGELDRGRGRFSFHRLDIADEAGMLAAFCGKRAHRPAIRRICHLAAQPGVRYSLENPMAYVRSNVAGHVVILELARRLAEEDQGFEHVVYASSSSVYGDNEKIPFAVGDRVDEPVSLYAATKRAGELISRSHAHLHGIPQTGLRFFTVYGPWGRPDMMPWLFTEAIDEGRPIRLFNEGHAERDFTFIDDVVSGVLAALDRPATRPSPDAPPHRLYNLGAGRSEPLLRFVELIESSLGKKATRELAPMQPGDVQRTFADVAESRRDLGWEAKTPIDEGVPRFVEWYREWTSRER